MLHLRRASIVMFFSVAQFLAAQTPVHRAAVAGLFYPGTKDSLLHAVEDCSRTAKPAPPLHAAPVGIIAPHAGYQFSGPVAASAYRAIEQGLYQTIIILGPSHFIPFDGIAIWPAGSWETPLGKISVDAQRAQKIMQRCVFVRDSAPLFGQEHSIETQVPFIQRTLPKCKIVPLELGTMAGDQFNTLSETLADLVEEAPGDVLIVASSDLSHYHTDAQARQIDNVTMNDILSNGPEQLVNDLNNHAAEMCGYAPVITMMLVAQRLGASPVKLAYANTANATGDTSRVVGYSAFAFVVDPRPATLSAEDKSALLGIARGAIEAAANKKRSPQISGHHPALNVNDGLFVTLTKNGELRGCIGTLRGSEPLWKAASDMGSSAACKDPRFPPLTPEELKFIQIEISVLTPMERIKPTDSILIGTDGLYLVQGNSSGVLLPQVPIEFHWDRAEFLKQLCFKAGLNQDAWKEPSSKLYKFTAQVFR